MKLTFQEPSEYDFYIKSQSLPDEKMVWHLTGIYNGGAFDWKPAIGAVEDGKVVKVED
ncbi:hypothetical protein [Bacillus sp. N1-1]|uniref:hypothetical protein n=1 Tax=Bacillus sp. N1-1 TaxID=2682541 RepID=UPI00131994BD|nr:hypothetical protein [Bacillus sp. N1-1]QHA92157.1 hypothetical protein GNK04_12380 [Bacillus sp. N1-1]